MKVATTIIQTRCACLGVKLFTTPILEAMKYKREINKNKTNHGLSMMPLGMNCAEASRTAANGKLITET